MAEPTPRFWEIFFEVYEALPRQGPGNRACAARALALCQGLPASPTIADLGCGVGGQTLHLAELTSGVITAVDRHAPSIARLERTVRERGLGHRVFPVVGDLAHPPLAAGSCDLIWSEGALYNLGIARALEVCRGLLRPGGCLAFTDAVWRMDDPPEEVRASFDLDYPAMGRTADILALVERSGLDLLGHFTLPDEAWWTDFYTPMAARVAEFRQRYPADPEALAALAQIGREVELHRDFADYYAYEFFVLRRPG